jgi:PAS domain S-box-containing protein
MSPGDEQPQGPQGGTGRPRAQTGEERAAERERYLHAVVAVQRLLLEDGPQGECEARVVRLLGEAVGVSRAYLFEVHPHPADGRQVVSMRAEWCAPGVSEELHNPEMHDLDLAARMPLLWGSLQRQVPMAGAVAGLPAEERAVLEPQGIRSIVVLPLVSRGEPVGLLGFDDCARTRVWDGASLDVLAGAAAALALARERRATELSRAREERQRQEAERQHREAERQRLEAERQRLEAERAREALDLELHALIEHLPDALFVTCEEVLVYANPAAVRALGAASAAALLGRAPQDFVHPEDRPAVAAAAARVAAGERAALGRFRYLPLAPPAPAEGAAAPAPRLAEASMLPHTFRGRRARVTVWRDVTEVQRVHEQLLLADRMAAMGALASGMAQEILDPLTCVLSNLELAERRLARAAPAPLPPPLEACTQALHEARQEAERVSRTVRQLRLFTRQEPSHGPVSPRAVFELVAAMAASEVRARARLVWELAPVPAVMADEGRLGQVLLNLVLNAAQAIPPGAPERHEVRLCTARAADGRVLLAVADSGEGIRRELLPRIFDPFFTTRGGRAGGGGGGAGGGARDGAAGLGLAIAHALVRGMGGELQVESEPGRGSTFRVLLPVAPVVREDPAGRPPPAGG